MEEMSMRISAWIKKKVGEAHARGAIVGLSGGIDSSVVAALAKKALGDDVLGVIMPCHSNDEDAKHAQALAERFDIRTYTVDLSGTYETLLGTLPEGSKLSNANLKPRLRMATLYYFANLNNYLVLGTDNKTESLTGYFTKYGDGGVDILPISHLYKRDVRKLAKVLGVPQAIIDKPPSAGLWEGQTDEGEMGLTYDELDAMLEAIENGDVSDFDPVKIKKVNEMVARSEHKRKLPEGFG